MRASKPETGCYQAFAGEALMRLPETEFLDCRHLGSTGQANFKPYVGFRNVSERALEELITNNGYRDGPDYLNYEKIYIHNSGYLPAIGICAYKQQAPMLWVRFSLPKLIYQSNIYEVCENDYNKIVQQIQNTVSSLGVDIPARAIYNAKIWEKV